MGISTASRIKTLSRPRLLHSTRITRAPHRAHRKEDSVKSLIAWLLRPFLRYKVKQLEAFTGPESYTSQMKRHRLIATLRASLLF
jgi:hypothetical protein